MDVLTDWDIREEFTLANLVFTVDILVLHVVEIVLLVAVSAETLTRGPNSFAIRASFHVSPVRVKSIFTFLTNLGLVLLEFLL